MMTTMMMMMLEIEQSYDPAKALQASTPPSETQTVMFIDAVFTIA